MQLGTDGRDTLEGTGQDDTLDGGRSGDKLLGRQGDDTLEGLSGNDRMFGGQGDDSALGGSGTDTAYGDAGNDSLSGGSGDDYLAGGTGHDRIVAGQGDDILIGNDGVDLLFGDDFAFDGPQSGDDRLYGGAETDFLYGGVGFDLLYGGTGADEFNVYGTIATSRDGETSWFDSVGTDVVMDLAAEDRISIFLSDNVNGEGTVYDFTDLDSDGSGRLDEADSGVSVEIVSIGSATRLSTVIDLEVALFGDRPGENELIVFGRVGLTDEAF